MYRSRTINEYRSCKRVAGSCVELEVLPCHFLHEWR